MANRLAPISANSEYDNPNPDTLFISYARKDVEFAQKLNADLQRHGVATWIDELGIRGGEDWPNRIATAIEGCKAMLIILSPDSVASRWVQRELAFADAKGKRVLPLLYKPCGLPAWFELRFGNVQRADFSRGSYETNLTELLASIEQVLGLTVAPPAPAPRPKPPAQPTPDVLAITSPIHLKLVHVPAGEFLMGSDRAKDKQAYDDEQPQHRIHVPEFYIGKYPVTYAQYDAFVRAGGRTSLSERAYTAHKIVAPNSWDWGDAIPSGEENHPAVQVFWYDCVAFCEWLSRETGKRFRLPTEAEWEKAARGTDGRIYPWGNDRPTAELCNFDKNVGESTPVGWYSPQGDSPYGCADMVGNVYEWTQSVYEDYPYDPADGRENLNVAEDFPRVVRGGASYSRARDIRCACRSRQPPNFRGWDHGFRVVVSPVPSGL